MDDEDGHGCTGWHTGTLGVTTLNAFKGTDRHPEKKVDLQWKFGATRKNLDVSNNRRGWTLGGPGRIPSRYKDAGPCPEPLPTHGHSFVPVAACFWLQFYAPKIACPLLLTCWQVGHAKSSGCEQIWIWAALAESHRATRKLGPVLSPCRHMVIVSCL